MLDCAVRITYPWVVVERIVRAWALYATKIACYEHDDDGAANLHCHLHLEGVNVSTKRLSQLASEIVPMTVPNPGKRATSKMSFRGKEYDKHPSGYAYLTKGKYDAKYLQGFTLDEAELWKKTWVLPTNHQKRTEWMKTYQDFMATTPVIAPLPQHLNWLDNPYQAGPPLPDYSRYIQLKLLAHSFCRKKLGSWCPQWNNYMKAIIINYRWNHPGISVPDKWQNNLEIV